MGETRVVLEGSLALPTLLANPFLSRRRDHGNRRRGTGCYSLSERFSRASRRAKNEKHASSQLFPSLELDPRRDIRMNLCGEDVRRTDCDSRPTLYSALAITGRVRKPKTQYSSSEHSLHSSILGNQLF